MCPPDLCTCVLTIRFSCSKTCKIQWARFQNHTNGLVQGQICRLWGHWISLLAFNQNLQSFEYLFAIVLHITEYGDMGASKAFCFPGFSM